MAPKAFVFGRAVKLGKEMGYCWSQVSSIILEMEVFGMYLRHSWGCSYCINQRYINKNLFVISMPYHV